MRSRYQSPLRRSFQRVLNFDRTPVPTIREEGIDSGDVKSSVPDTFLSTISNNNSSVRIDSPYVAGVLEKINRLTRMLSMTSEALQAQERVLTQEQLCEFCKANEDVSIPMLIEEIGYFALSLNSISSVLRQNEEIIETNSQMIDRLMDQASSNIKRADEHLRRASDALNNKNAEIKALKETIREMQERINVLESTAAAPVNDTAQVQPFRP